MKQTKMPASATVISGRIANISLQQCDELSVDFAVISRQQQSNHSYDSHLCEALRRLIDGYGQNICIRSDYVHKHQTLRWLVPPKSFHLQRAG